ncbi:Ubiquitin-conjugating enzyme E2 28 [Amphibalanus amphitrite]|uniref:E2 ubiquitin-conjugating enzyme n=1 Tax=Amphibalanus amphitrite TaxID=1232801 RepID=A0A6A4V4E8_AMPAM|nr:Ubiquitin-conjugating enzyme E2 28 [Amphibalanus amphitrite]
MDPNGNEGADAPQQCLYCDGFYGMSFGQYVCSTCHLFLFPEDVNHEAYVGLTSEQKSDDSDSGNEEPPDLFAVAGGGGGRRARSPPPPMPPPSPPPPLPPPAPAVDRLAERVERLSVPHPADGATTASMGRLPPEVLLVIFGYLDDISMWAVSNVCKRWRHLLMSHVPDEEWHRFTEKRFPLFRALYRVHCWSYIYAKLIESAPCLLCLHQMTPHCRTVEDERSFRRRRLVHEQNALKADPPEGIRATPLDDTYSHWQASITGPAGSAYEGGVFLLYLQVPDSYPLRPPVVRFITKVLHPNVSRHGDIGIDSIHHNWTLALTIGKVLISIQSLLTDPYCKVCMEPAVGALCQRNWLQFVGEARAWTWKHAMHDALMPPDEELRERLAGGGGDRTDGDGHRQHREGRHHHHGEDRHHHHHHHRGEGQHEHHREQGSHQHHRENRHRGEEGRHHREEESHQGEEELQHGAEGPQSPEEAATRQLLTSSPGEPARPGEPGPVEVRPSGTDATMV